MKSKYTSPKSVAKNQTVPIGIDDPRLAWDKRGQTYARQGAEIEEIGADGKSLIAGGSRGSNAYGSPNINDDQVRAKTSVPPSNGNPGYILDSDSIALGSVSNVSTAWSTESGKTEDLIVTFNWDYEDPANVTVSEFILEITLSTGTIRQTPYGSFPVNRTQTAQTAILTKEINKATIGDLSVNITKVCVFAIDPFYNVSAKACDTTVPAYVLNLPVPVITVTSAISGYSVAYTIPSQSVFDSIDIYEYESDSSTEPTGVTYSRVYFDQISPANIITVNNNARWVKARFTSKVAVSTAFCAAQKVTPTSPITVDNEGPAAPTGSVTGGLESSGTIGFNAFLNISWTAVSDTTLRGYRIRFRPVTIPASNYSYVDSPGNGTAFRITGLASGTSYEVAIAAYDEYNNTSSSYQTLTGSPVSTAGSPFIGTNVSTTGYFEAGVAGTDTGVFRFGYGVATGKRGLVFNTNNYWYIDSSQSASLKVGGTDNYVTWDGSSLVVTGDLQAKKGSFSGNVNMASGASIYSGTLTGNTVTPTGDTGGSLSGKGYILNKDGLTFNSSTVNDITTINGETGLLTTKSALIGGWSVTSSAITKTATGQGKISLDSTNGYIYVTKDTVETTTAGINSPADDNDNVFWSGGTGPTDETSPFRVRLNGDLFASSANITGEINATSGNISGPMDVDGQLYVGDVTIESLSGSFSITDTIGGYGVISTSESGRLVLGHYQEDFGRQVKVARSAQIAGDPDGAGAANSGGLRNIFTSTVANFYSNAYLSANEANGDVVLLYTP